mmetsp:Transcript_975/g.2674  ORF Transcript_975/g.2674 Transcript_975/m.2674 type:complete len:95 (-) Transcript_975:221-505(-)
MTVGEILTLPSAAPVLELVHTTVLLLTAAVAGLVTYWGRYEADPVAQTKVTLAEVGTGDGAQLTVLHCAAGVAVTAGVAGTPRAGAGASGMPRK